MREEVVYHCVLISNRHVKYVGHARVNYTLGFYCHLEVGVVDYSNVRSSGIEECGHAGTEPGTMFTLGSVKLVLFIWAASPPHHHHHPPCPDLDLIQLYQILTLHCTGRTLMCLLLVPQSKDTPGKNQHFAQIFTVLIQTASAECW